MTLSSPSFLYADLGDDTDDPDHKAASRLALALWDSIPDDELTKAAEKKSLSNEKQIRTHAQRMLRDPRTRVKLLDFFHHWLEIDERDLAKDRELFPEFDNAVISDLRYSLDRFVEYVVWSRNSDYRDLLRANYLILNDRLLALYGPNGDGTVTSPTSGNSCSRISREPV